MIPYGIARQHALISLHQKTAVKNISQTPFEVAHTYAAGVLM